MERTNDMLLETIKELYNNFLDTAYRGDIGSEGNDVIEYAVAILKKMLTPQEITELENDVFDETGKYYQ